MRSLFIEGMLRLLIWINSKCNKCLNCQKSKNSFRLYSYCLCLSLSFCLIVTLIYTELKEFKAFVLLKPSWEILTGGIHWIQTRPMCSTLPASRSTMYVTFILKCHAIFKTCWVQCSAVSHCQCGSRPSSFAAEAAVGRFGSWALLGLLLGLVAAAARDFKQGFRPQS